MLKKMLFAASCVVVFGVASSMSQGTSVKKSNSEPLFCKISQKVDIVRPVSSPAILGKTPISISVLKDRQSHGKELDFLEKELKSRHFSEISTDNSPQLILEEAQLSLSKEDFYTASCLFEFLENPNLIIDRFFYKASVPNLRNFRFLCDKCKTILQEDIDKKYIDLYGQ